jgi:predicted nucleic acid-binding protein
MTTVAYVDASALVKLVIDEPESPSMFRWYVESARLATSRIGIIETRRAANRHVHDPGQLEAVVRSMVIIEVDDVVASNASHLSPPTLRTLDAIHIATALAIGPDVGAFVTYDLRQADAARRAGLPVVMPAA